MLFNSLSSAFHHARRFGRRAAAIDLPLYVVDNDGLDALAKKHPFNENIFKEHYKRDPNFPYYLFIGKGKSTYFIICDKESRFIASATLRFKKNDSTTITLSQISVSPQHRDSGHASRLIREMAIYLNKDCPEIKQLFLSSYEEMGKIYLKKEFYKLASEFNAEIYEQDIETSFFPTLIPKQEVKLHPKLPIHPRI